MIELIERARKQQLTALNEADSKKLLKQYGIHVVDEQVIKMSADAEAEAEAEAEKIGYPVVIKGLGSRLTHKTEKGLVKLNLKNTGEVATAAGFIIEAAGDDLEGLLIQPMVQGKREFVAGLFRDEQFGPVVMFGLGGIFTEALGDVVFRVAPVDEIEAGEMIDELRAGKLLGAFRGEEPADKEALIKTITGLSRIGIEAPEISEIDINPLLVSADGSVTAVDGLVVFGEKNSSRETPEIISPDEINRLFHPKSIAFVGASADITKWGHLMYSCVLAGNYEGGIYLVNPQGGEIIGKKVYKSVSEIADPVDLAVVTIPAGKVPDLLPEFADKGIKSVLLISSGFGEVGEEGRRLEYELVKKAREAGVFIIGPNTMGICNPHISFYCTGTHVRPIPGGITLLTQSGNLGTQLLAFAEQENMGIRAFCGSGNEAMIKIEDYIEGLEKDKLTKTVVLYIESIKNGRRFFESLKRNSPKKPIIILKGGRTAAGSNAAASHTGAMASDSNVFMAACRQAGAVLAKSPMDLLDLSASFSSLPLPEGNRVGIVTLGGGWGVVASDLCEENGLVLPALNDEVISKIDRLLPPYWSRANPIDVVGEMNTDVYREIIDDLFQWDECDAIIHMGIIGRIKMIKAMLESTVAINEKFDESFLKDTISFLENVEKETIKLTVELMEKYKKPIIGVYLLSDGNTRMVTEVAGCEYKGINFSTPERAVKVLAKMAQYSKWRSLSCN